MYLKFERVVDMIKVIETNLSLHLNDEIIDHQSRVIEVESWEEFVSEIKEGRTVNRDGTMYGTSVPRQSRIENFKSDDFHLSCDIYNYADIKTKKFAYLIKL